MAVQSVEKLGANWSREEEAGARAILTEQVVRVTETTDGPEVISKSPLVPSDGDTYNFSSAAEQNDTYYVKRQKIFRPMPNSVFVWKVLTTWMQSAEQYSDPNTWRDIIEYQDRIIQTQNPTAKNLTEHSTGGGVIRPAGTPGLITNSAGAIVWPQPNWYAVEDILLITTIRDSYDYEFYKPYKNTRNASQCVIDRDQVKATYEPDELRLVSVRPVRQWYPGAEWLDVPDPGGESPVPGEPGRWRFRITFEFWIRDDTTIWPRRWNEYIIDQGFERAAYSGASNPQGPGNLNDFANTYAGSPKRISLIDPATGQRMMGGSLLNGSGEVLNDAVPVKLEYEMMPAKNHNDLGVFD